MRAVHTPRSWKSPQESKVTRWFVGTLSGTHIHEQRATSAEAHMESLHPARLKTHTITMLGEVLNRCALPPTKPLESSIATQLSVYYRLILELHVRLPRSTADQTGRGVNSSHLPAGVAHFSGKSLLGWGSQEDSVEEGTRTGRKTQSCKNNFDHRYLFRFIFKSTFACNTVGTFPLGKKQKSQLHLKYITQ